MAYWLFDGSCTLDKNSYSIKIAQYNNDWMYEELKKFPFKIYKCKESLMIHNKELGKELSKFGKCTTKFIPDNIKELSPELIRIFLLAHSKADGSVRKGKVWKGYKFNDSIQFFTSSDKLASDLGELILKAGGRPSYYLNKCAGKEIEFRNGVYTINKDVWIINWNTQLHNYLYNMEIKDVEYNDYVYCVEVPKYHTLLVRRNGKICWSGNCRSVTDPYYDKIEGETNLRASRTEDDDYKLVDVKDYQDWYDRYIEKPHHILYANDDKNYKDTEDEKYKKRIGDFYFLKKVDKIDYNIAKEIFSEYEPNMINLKYENAIVIKADGSVYVVLGGENFVDTTVLGDLTGAYITHNHPKKYTEFSFSNEDINSFINDKLEYLKGIDYKYEYELSRDLFESNEASTNPSEWANFENVRHEYVIGLASGRNIRYRRKKYE
jgi:phage protein